jgi:hypothetical protein
LSLVPFPLKTELVSLGFTAFATIRNPLIIPVIMKVGAAETVTVILWVHQMGLAWPLGNPGNRIPVHPASSF